MPRPYCLSRCRQLECVTVVRQCAARAVPVRHPFPVSAHMCRRLEKLRHLASVRLTCMYWLNLTGFVYLRLSQSSNVSKRLNCLSFQTCKCSSDGCKLFGGTAEALSYVAVLLRQFRVRGERCRQRSRRNIIFVRDWNFFRRIAVIYVHRVRVHFGNKCQLFTQPSVVVHPKSTQ